MVNGLIRICRGKNPYISKQMMPSFAEHPVKMNKKDGWNFISYPTINQNVIRGGPGTYVFYSNAKKASQVVVRSICI